MKYRLYSFLLFMLPLSIFSQQVAWVKTFGGLLRDEGRSMERDSDGNILVVGRTGGGDFDPGTGVVDVDITSPSTSSLYYDAFVAKYDSLGNLIWAKSTGGNSEDAATEVAVDQYNNVIVTGYLRGSADLDPGTGSLMVNGGLNEYPYIQKFDPDGNLIWAKYSPTYCDNRGPSVAVDLENNIVWAVGTSYMQFNINGVDSTMNGRGVFILKLQPDGNTTWCKLVTNGEYVNCVKTDHLNNIVLTGKHSAFGDFDPGPQQYSLPTSSQSFCMKLNPDGQFVWAKSTEMICSPYPVYTNSNELQDFGIDHDGNIIGTGHTVNGGNNANYIYKIDPLGTGMWVRKNSADNFSFKNGIAVDALGNSYNAFAFNESMDANPGFGINTIYADPLATCNLSPQYALGLQKLDANGNYVWAKPLTGCLDVIHDFAVVPNGGLLFTGYVYDFFNLSAVGGPSSIPTVASCDVLMVRLNQDICSGLALVLDTVTSLECVDSAFVAVHGESGVSPWSYSFNGTTFATDSIFYFTEAGLVNVIMKDSVGCSQSTTLLVNGPLVPQNFDLKANLVCGAFRPGFDDYLTVDAYTDGCIPVTGQLKLCFDTILELVNSVPVPDFTIGDTLVWNFENLTYDSVHFTPQLVFHTTTLAEIGDTIYFTVVMTPLANDANPANNVRVFDFPVVNGYDPNDKKVFPAKCDEHFVENSAVLTYTIRFQNTGNSEAIGIRVEDSLDVNLDHTSLRLIANSHPMHVELSDGHKFSFVFDNIHLPPASADYAASNGYVIYEVDQQPNLPLGTKITNRAFIYFDFNPAIITNTTYNTVFDGDLDVHPCVEVSTASLSNAEHGVIKIYPNPSPGIVKIASLTAYATIKVTDLHGRMISTNLSTQPDVIDLSSQPQGFYFIELTANSMTYNFKLVKQ